MAGYNGLGFNKKAIAASSGGGFYEIQLSEVVGGEVTINEDYLNKTIIAKTSVTDYYIAIFLTNIGKDGDYIKFKNVDDVTPEDPQPYLEFYGEGYTGDIFSVETWGYFMQFEDEEMMFIKEGEKWRKYKNTGLFKIEQDENPTLDNHDIYFDRRNIVFNSELFFMEGVNGEFGNYNKLIRLYPNSIEIHQNIIPAVSTIINLGEAVKRFVTLFAENGDFSGTVKAAEPVDANDLTTKNYVDNNAGGISKLQDDLNPILGGNLDAEYKNITNVQQLDVNSINLLTGLMSNLDMQYNNIANVQQLDVNSINLLTGLMSNLDMQYNNITNIEQLDVNTLQVLTGLMGNLDVAYNNILNVQQLDVNILNVLTGMMSNLEMQFNKITGLADPETDQDAATKKYVDDNNVNLGALTEDILPLSNGVYNLGSQAIKFNANLLNATIDNLSVNNDVRPLENDGGNLGISTKRWTNVYTKAMDIENGATGSFTSQDGKTVTVTKGIITSIV